MLICIPIWLFFYAFCTVSPTPCLFQHKMEKKFHLMHVGLNIFYFARTDTNFYVQSKNNEWRRADISIYKAMNCRSPFISFLALSAWQDRIKAATITNHATISKPVNCESELRIKFVTYMYIQCLCTWINGIC